MSYILVVAQFLLLAYLGWPLLPLATLPLLIIGAIVFVAGLALFAWSYASMSRESFSVMPEPREGSVLAQSGPYAHIRHPMYTAVLLCGIGAALVYMQPLKWMAMLMLFAVLWIKLKREENYLLQKHPGYKQYQLRTKALVPQIL
jgi:protein-S-isoprenylcysteine O-methyltransferase Ste14